MTDGVAEAQKEGVGLAHSVLSCCPCFWSEPVPRHALALHCSVFSVLSDKESLSLSLPPTPSLRLTLGVLQIHILKQVLSLNLELTGLVRLVASELQESA